jgi:5-amino-6-(5-phosphoribosylamino)uracil reductase
MKTLLVTGGGQLVASLLEADLIDEFWITVCPLLLGGTDAPTLVEGKGFPAKLAPRLTLLSAEVIDQEVFLHYVVKRSTRDKEDSDEELDSENLIRDPKNEA